MLWVGDGTAHPVALLQAVDAPGMRARVPGAQGPPFRRLYIGIQREVIAVFTMQNGRPSWTAE